ncbi:carboxymuconolactone decarboxylase family protein [Paenibacillus apiarius]|uniref:Carboxymuconolactone decarboxylase family protein n=1 Tax=Paenibacillus apiarius TaxID=46240 RepID=A0ABT4DRX9_9BACL|nr:carboxymuconolactone decarboxylase family protein [Paenibacillus apiarius]MCY9514312.1 carboxymuconolactone decarboxylase family protein [Paenibacillus apiarius]MCY9520105.1 carboxymuconolactone decarboxylase family protein [Paenibacillus apiarius]MCY9550112.1 carboxymuconolactone decarboxylase family protein [Paenibacillus apiarius]MCY9560277.1 carboxymuconolactone decarboxylase family protein [Paenibacillus apiarius]MCY9683175.1 carboxymuconolactone decarboxylase family protein [Paenibaci
MAQNRMNEHRYERGLEVFQHMAGPKGMAALEKVRRSYPDMAEFIIANGFGDIYARPGLDLKQRELVTLSSLITQGAAEELTMHVNVALNVGLTPEELIEVVIQCTAYAGFPKALSAFNVMIGEFRKRGIELTAGPA